MTAPHFPHQRLLLLSALGAVLTLAGCATAPERSSGGEPAKSAVAETPQVVEGAITDAIELLYKGDTEAARRLLVSLVQRHPDDTAAAGLLRQIETAPEVLLGPESFAYTSRSGDTMSSLAQRFLGDPMLFYALARYNGLTEPGSLTAGRALKIPGRAPSEPSRAQRPAAPRAAPQAAARTPEPKAAVAAAPSGGSARAAQLRAAGLEQLNRGAINGAVSLLQQASELDPGNALIKRDLDRALRISRTVQAKP